MDEEETVNLTLQHSINSSFDANDTVYHDEGGGNSYGRIYLEVFAAIGLLSTISNVVLAVAILKFPKLRRETTNIFILHLAILQSVYFFCTPLTFRLAIELGLGSPISLTLFCILNEFEGVLMLVIILLEMVLALDWLLKVYCTVRYRRFQRVQNFFLGIVYLLGTFSATITTQFCIRYMYAPFIVFFEALGYLTILAIMLCLNLVHLCKRRHLTNNRLSKNVGLVLPNLFVAMWLPVIMCFVLLLVVEHAFSPYVYIIFTALGFTSPILSAIFLFIYEDNYHIFIKRLLLCKCDTYVNDSLDDQQAVVYNEEQGVEIAPTTTS